MKRFFMVILIAWFVVGCGGSDTDTDTDTDTTTDRDDYLSQDSDEIEKTDGTIDDDIVEQADGDATIDDGDSEVTDEDAFLSDDSDSNATDGDESLSDDDSEVQDEDTYTPPPLKDQLMAMGLDESDAEYLLANHLIDVQTVLADTNRIFKDMPSLDTMFALPTDPDGSSFTDPQMTTWSEENKIKFKKMFGRFAFVINTPQFIQSFNAHINLLNPAYQGAPPATPFPQNYSEFRAAAQKALVEFSYQYKFFISTRESWTAWGMVGLKLKVENIMFGQPADGAPHNTEALILHEFTHTWGYTHDAADQSNVTSKPNNIPYYVQIIVGVNAEDPTAQMEWNTPKSLLTIYFGNDV